MKTGDGRDRQDQLQAMQKANAEAAGHAAKAKQAARSGLKNLTSQAGAALGAIVSKASPARHPGQAAEAARPGTHFNPDPSVRVNDGSRIQSLRDGSGMTGLDERMFPPLSDETISSNQRLATALSKRRGVGDLPRFTTDAINTDPKKAIPEIADLLQQLHASDPVQASDLFSQTVQSIAPEQGEALHQAVQSYGQNNSKKQYGADADQVGDVDFMAPPEYPESEKFGSRWQTNDLVAQKTSPPSQDDPGKPDKHNENSCRRLKAQLEVDQANADAASNLYTDAISIVEEALLKLKAKIEERDKAIINSAPDALVGSVRAVKSLTRGKLPDAHDIPGPIGSLLAIAELNQEIAVLEMAYNEAMSERAFRLRELKEANDRAVSTFQKWQAMGCR